VTVHAAHAVQQPARAVDVDRCHPGIVSDGSGAAKYLAGGHLILMTRPDFHRQVFALGRIFDRPGLRGNICTTTG
jgi:hypothetical protein